jgi:transcriptional regulator with XRE-family HTH domain
MNHSISAAAGRQIQQLRIDRGLSIRKLARMAGIQASALDRVEQGEARPSIALLDGLARELDTTILEILRSARHPPRVVDTRVVDPRKALDEIARRITELPESVGDKVRAAVGATVRHAIQVCAGNQSAAARLLRMERKAFTRRVARNQRPATAGAGAGSQPKRRR